MSPEKLAAIKQELIDLVAERNVLTERIMNLRSRIYFQEVNRFKYVSRQKRVKQEIIKVQIDKGCTCKLMGEKPAASCSRYDACTRRALNKE